MKNRHGGSIGGASRAVTRDHGRVGSFVVGRGLGSIGRSGRHGWGQQLGQLEEIRDCRCEGVLARAELKTAGAIVDEENLTKEISEARWQGLRATDALALSVLKNLR